MKPGLSEEIFEKSSIIKFHEYPSSRSSVDLYGRTDGWMDRQTRWRKQSLFEILRTRLKPVEVIGGGVIRDTVSEFAWSDWGKPWETSVTLLDFTARIRTRFLHNTLEKL